MVFYKENFILCKRERERESDTQIEAQKTLNGSREDKGFGGLAR